jgi:hypothetical protein
VFFFSLESCLLNHFCKSARSLTSNMSALSPATPPAQNPEAGEQSNVDESPTESDRSLTSNMSALSPATPATPAQNPEAGEQSKVDESPSGFTTDPDLTPLAATPSSDMESPSDSSASSNNRADATPDLQKLESESEESPSDSSASSNKVVDPKSDSPKKSETETEDEITPLLNPQTQVMAAKMQNPKTTFVAHPVHVRALPKWTDRQSLRSYKTLGLSRWQYGLRHPGFCTFAAIDQDDRTTAVAPGIDWHVNNQLCTVVTPFLKTGGPHMVAFVLASLLQRIMDPQDAVAKIEPADVFAVEVCDLYIYIYICIPLYIYTYIHTYT